MRKYTCNDCGKVEEYQNIGAARAAGCAISKDYSKFYCAKCAPLRRNVGRYGGKRSELSGNK